MSLYSFYKDTKQDIRGATIARPSTISTSVESEISYLIRKYYCHICEM